LGVITLSPTLEVLTFFFLSTIDDILSTSCFPPGIFLEIAPAMTIAPFVISPFGKNKHTGEIWSKDKGNHYGEGSWKVGVKKGANPKKGKKITVDKTGKIDK
jgi:hypothetical protein